MTTSIKAAGPRAAEPFEPSLADTILSIRDLHVHFFTYSGVVKAVNGMSLSVKRGEMTALVGESGSGKSVLAWSILGLTKPPGRIVGGEVLWHGDNLLTVPASRLQKLRGREMSLIVSSPRSHLHALTRVGRQIEMARTAAGGKQGAREATLEALKSVEMPDPVRVYNAYPHELSGGMAQRVLIAMALINSPELVIADDATNALDVTVQRQVLDLMTLRIKEKGASALMITHDLGIVAQYCRRATIVYRGVVLEEASTERLFENPLHPHTQALITTARRRRSEAPGRSPSAHTFGAQAAATGCQMAERCPVAMQECRRVVPELREIESGHWVRCLRHDGVSALTAPLLISEAQVSL